jgi:hypothetical protein
VAVTEVYTVKVSHEHLDQAKKRALESSLGRAFCHS